MDIKLEVDVGDVALDGPRAEEELVGDLAIAQTGGNQLHHLGLARCQHTSRAAGGRCAVQMLTGRRWTATAR